MWEFCQKRGETATKWQKQRKISQTFPNREKFPHFPVFLLLTPLKEFFGLALSEAGDIALLKMWPMEN